MDKYDIFFIGGGQDFEQEVLLRDLASGKGKAIAWYVGRDTAELSEEGVIKAAVELSLIHI